MLSTVEFSEMRIRTGCSLLEEGVLITTSTWTPDDAAAAGGSIRGWRRLAVAVLLATLSMLVFFFQLVRHVITQISKSADLESLSL